MQGKGKGSWDASRVSSTLGATCVMYTYNSASIHHAADTTVYVPGTNSRAAYSDEQPSLYGRHHAQLSYLAGQMVRPGIMISPPVQLPHWPLG